MISRVKINVCAAILVGITLSGTTIHAATQPLSKPLSKSEAKLYSTALTAAEKGNWRSAHRQANKIRGELPAKVMRWLELSQRGNRKNFDAISGFVFENDDWPRRGTLRRRAEEALDGSVPPREVMRWFSTYPPLTTDGKTRLVEAVIANGQKEKARKLIRETWVSANFGRKQEREFRKRYRKFLNKADHTARLDRLLWDGQITRARRMIPLVDDATQKLAMARISLRAFRGGVDWHIRQVPASLRTDPGLVFERARWRRRKGLDNGAYELLKNVPANAPFATKWWVERSIIARRLLAKGHISEAYRLARANGLSTGARFVEAEWLAGWIALRHLDEPKTAYTHFSNIGNRVAYPISKARAAYWVGRAAEASGDLAAATKSFQAASKHGTTYYGQLAAARSNSSVVLTSSRVAPTKPERSIFERDERVRAVRLLSQVGARNHVRPFMYKLLSEAKTPQRQVLTAELANQIGRRDFAVRAGRKSYRTGSPLPEIAYPIIKMTGNHPEQALLHAIVRQESNFDMAAVSHAGARGLMQLMPATARSVAKRLRVRYSPKKLTRSSSYNVRLGQAYLGQMINRFDGSYILAIASYNAGPSAAKRWVRQNGDPREPGVDVIDWVESIPYRETRNYVQRVIENLQVYRMRMGGPMLAEGIVNDLRR
ncbi:MAG: soluble lytic murein transglycosylase [Paracoccaceae bacterium]|jgi:soluble lytic murein transglycosylase